MHTRNDINFKYLADLRRILLDKNGLTVILQGGLFKSNIVNVANHVLNIFDLFPSAQIIVSISSSDFLFEKADFETLVATNGAKLGDTINANAFKLICAHSEVILATGALPLPSIKSDIEHTYNNFNLQLASAQLALEKSKGLYVLRVRNDLIFTDTNFIKYYADRATINRQNGTFSERILISSLFTVNPYLAERMPFHFSDWFHFGLTNDVKALWQVEPMIFADAVYFRSHPHPPGTNYIEKRIYTRLAVEQHLYFSFYKNRWQFDDLKYFNDTRYISQSMQALLDDFIPMHPLSSGVYFAKYQTTFHDSTVEMSCITAGEWDFLAANRKVDPEIYFQKKIETVKRRLAYSAISKDLALVIADLNFFFLDRIPAIVRSVMHSLFRLKR